MAKASASKQKDKNKRMIPDSAQYLKPNAGGFSHSGLQTQKLDLAYSLAKRIDIRARLKSNPPDNKSIIEDLPIFILKVQTKAKSICSLKSVKEKTERVREADGQSKAQREAVGKRWVSISTMF